MLETNNMDFSMARIMNSIDSDAVNVVWANSTSSTIHFTEQTSNVLVFTDTNTQGDLVSLDGIYNDTIHVGSNDTVYCGGNDLLIGWNSSNMLILEKFGSAWFENDDLIIDGSTTITSIDLSIDVMADVDGVFMNIMDSMNDMDSATLSLVSTDS